jgi:hypothetical protein
VSDKEAHKLEATVGHPGDKCDALLDRVQHQRIRRFADVATDWLDVIWTLDAYRVSGIPPRGMGDSTNPNERLAAVYRGKGHWFARLLAALLEHHTAQRVAPKIRVKGSSQFHQVDLAWPERQEDPLMCAETKVTGAPAHGSYPERGAMSDFANRRKELTFAATDLKLYRRDLQTAIRHWGAWRETATPKAHFMWAARRRRGKERTLKSGETRASGRDEISRLIEEAQVSTYLEGAGIFAWQLRADGLGYEEVLLPPHSRVTALDDVLYKIASQIVAMAPKGRTPAPIRPSKRAVPDERLPSDDSENVDGSNNGAKQ